MLPFKPEDEFYTPEGCYIIEQSNSPDDEAVSIARARVSPGVTTQWHRLAGTVERYVILSGCGLVEVGELKPQVVGAGDSVIIPAMCRQRISNTGSDDLVFLAICSPRFRPEVYENLENEKA
ncbi:MAG TPA: cupin domain-containing protein [Thiotrichales bacterium]|nr:cupin domain-containing protein [Thiotrichales bacterium]